jgi:hypothetical protein
MAEEFEVLAAGRGFWRGPVLAAMTQFTTVSFVSSPNLWCWSSVFVECFFFVLVVFASTCYVTLLLLFFYHDTVVFLPLFKNNCDIL